MRSCLGRSCYAKVLLSILLATMMIACSNNTESQTEEKDSSRFKSLEDFKKAFENAGGQCWGWNVEPLSKGFSQLLARGNCDDKTVLLLYTDGYDVKSYALEFRKTTLSLGFKVSLLVGENWMINSDQATKVHRKLGGTLITR